MVKCIKLDFDAETVFVKVLAAGSEDGGSSQDHHMWSPEKIKLLVTLAAGRGKPVAIFLSMASFWSKSWGRR